MVRQTACDSRDPGSIPGTCVGYDEHSIAAYFVEGVALAKGEADPIFFLR